MKYHISSQTREQIMQQVGSFELVSFNSFEAHGQRRCRYTVTKPNGKKQIHLIGYENGVIRLAS